MIEHVEPVARIWHVVAHRVDIKHTTIICTTIWIHLVSAATPRAVSALIAVILTFVDGFENEVDVGPVQA